MNRVPMDLAAYERRVRDNPCFICGIVNGSEGHAVFYEDADHIAFVGRYPTLYGHVLVSPKRHLEHVVRDLPLDAYLALQTVLHRVARAVETVVPAERTYLLSLGSQDGNSHLHWHVAPLPPGTPYKEQQHYALMAENGVIPWSAEQAEALAERLRAAL